MPGRETLFYAPDTSRPANTDQWSKDYTGRVTWQVTQKHKIVVAASAQPNCNCFFNLLNPTGGIPWAPEVSAQHRYNPQVGHERVVEVPVTDRLLVDTDFAYLYVDQRTVRQPSTGLDVQVTDTGMNYRYGSARSTSAPPAPTSSCRARRRSRSSRFHM
jgi:hypothetical protein